MASDAVVNLVVNATQGEAQITADVRRIADTAERNAPRIDLRVDIDQSSVVRALRRLETATDDQSDRITRSLDEGFSDLTASLTAHLDLLSGQLGDLDNGINQLNQSLRDAADAGDDADRSVTGLTDDMDDADNSSRRLAGTFGRVAAGAAGAATRLTLMSAAASGAVPVVGAVVTQLTNLAPAAAAGVTAFVTMKAAALTLKLGLTGVEDALSAVFDPDADPAAVAEALEKLSGNARAFVVQAQKMKPALDALRLDVQDRLFKGLDKTLENTAKSVFPDLERAAQDFADTFNRMAKDTGSQAEQLAEDGTLGKALDSGTSAFAKLEKVPGQVLAAIVRLAAAGGPLLNRLTKRVADTADSISKRLEKASKSGALEDSVNEAGDAFKQLGRIAGNVFGAISNVFGAIDASGGSLFGTLEMLTQALEDATATKTFQDTLGALVDLSQTLAQTAIPLLGEAFKALAPVVQTLAPVFEQIVERLGDDLMELIPALAPVLEELAGLFGDLLIAVLPLIEEGIQVLIENMPELQELFGALRELVKELAPLILYLAVGLGEFLEPAVKLVIIATTGWILIIKEVVEAIRGIIEVAGTLVGDLNGAVKPAITSVSQLLDGDFQGSLDTATNGVIGFTATAVSRFDGFSTRLLSITASMFARFNGIADSGWANFQNGAQSMALRVAGFLNGLADDLVSIALGIASAMYSAGQRIMDSLSQGMFSRLTSVVSTVQSIVGQIRDFMPFSPAKRGPLSGRGYPLYSGHALIESFAQGIAQRAGLLNDTLERTLAVPMANTGLTASLNTTGNVATVGGATAAAARTVNAVSAPNVTVYLGNELVRQYVTTVVDHSNEQRDRLAAQGTRI